MWICGITFRLIYFILLGIQVDIMPVRIPVPNVAIIIYKILYVCIPAQEPDELMSNQLEWHFLSRQERESFAQVKSHLMTENASRIWHSSSSTLLCYASNHYFA
jgi:hypothetical protein